MKNSAFQCVLTRWVLPTLLATQVVGCAAAAAAASGADTTAASDSGATDSDATAGGTDAATSDVATGGENTATATYADGHTATFTGGALGWGGLGHDSTGANAAFMGVLLTEGAASGQGAATLKAGGHMLLLTFIRSSYPAAATPLLPGIYNFVLGPDGTGAQEYARADFIDSNWQAASPGVSAMCKYDATVTNSGTYLGTLTLTEVTSTHVSGSFDTVAKNKSSESAHISGSFSADIDPKLGTDGPNIKCMQ